MNSIRLTVREAMESNGLNRYDSDVLLKLCVALDCGIEDLIEVVR